MTLQWLRSGWSIGGAIILGIIIGVWLPQVATRLNVFAQIYLSLLHMCIIPLVIFAIASTIAQVVKLPALRQIFLKALLFFAVAVVMAALFGIISAWLFHLGEHLDESTLAVIGEYIHTHADESFFVESTAGGMSSFLLSFVPANIVEAIAEESMLAIVTFSILLGITLGVLSRQTSAVTLDLLNSLYETFLQLMGGILYLLPFGLICMTANQVATTSFAIFQVLFNLIMVIYLGLFLLLIVYIVLLSIKYQRNPFSIIKDLNQPLFIALATSSSFAALPFTIKTLVNKFHLKREQVKLLAPIAIKFNPQSTSFVYAVLAMFAMHLFHVPMSIEYLLILMVGSIMVAAAVSGAPMVATFSAMSIVFEPMGIPTQTTILLFIAMAYFVDFFATLVNVAADCVVISYVAKEDPKNRDG